MQSDAPEPGARRRQRRRRPAIMPACVAALLAAAMVAIAQADNCFDVASQSEPGPPSYLARMAARQHPFPSTWRLMGNWPQGQRCGKSKPRGWPFPVLPDTCKHPSNLEPAEQLPSVDAFKIYQRKLYVSRLNSFFDKNDTQYGMRRDAFALYRRTFIEALLIGLHVYTDVPDLEFAVSFLDTPRRCDLNMPVLQYSVFVPPRKASRSAGRASGPASSSSLGSDEQPSPSSTPSVEEEDEADTMCMPGAVPLTPQEREQCRKYNRGWAISNPDTWQLSVTPDQLSQGYAGCVLKRSNSTASLADRRPVAFWRGSNTGASKGWSAEAITQLQARTGHNQSACLAQVLLNKRIFMVLEALHHPWMDMKLSALHGVDHCHTEGDKELVRQVKAAATVAEHHDADARARSLLLVVVDGWGPAYRLPLWLLSVTPIVHVESIMKQWLVPYFKPHVHYAAAASDLSDLPALTHRLLRNAKTPEGLERLQTMAIKARDAGADLFSVLGQVDAIFSAAKAATKACGWPVKSPRDEPGWAPVRLLPQGQHGWMTRLFNHEAFKPMEAELFKDFSGPEPSGWGAFFG